MGNNFEVIFLVFAEHFIESIIQLGGDGINLHLLSDNLVLKVVDSQMKLADVHLGVLGAGFRLLQTNVDLLDLLLVLLLPLPRLLLRNFQLFSILSNGLQLILNDYDSALSILDPLVSTLQLVLLPLPR